MALRALGLVARFGLTLYLAKYLSLPDFGLFGLIVAALAVTPAIAGWGINYFLNREVVGKPKLESGRMIRDRLVVTLASLVVLSLVASPILIKFHLMPSLTIVVLTILLAILESLAFDLYQVLINIGHPFAANFLYFLRSAAWVFPLVALGIMLPAFRSLTVALTFWLAGSILSLVAMIWVLSDWPLKSILASKIEMGATLQIVRRARLIYLSDLGIAMTPYLDRYIVAHFLGLSASGLFTLYWSVANAPYMLVNTGVIQMTFPALVREFQTGDLSKAKKLITEMRAKIFVLAGVFCLAAGPGCHFYCTGWERPHSAPMRRSYGCYSWRSS